jgi:hypothetical protein
LIFKKGRWVEQIESILHRACDGETYISVCLVVIDMLAVDEGNHVDREKIIEPLGRPSGSDVGILGGPMLFWIGAMRRKRQEK